MRETGSKPRLHAFGKTDRGLLRLRNEDNLFCDPENGTFAVADGLGGVPQGDLASETAIAALQAQVDATGAISSLDWKTIFNKINQKILALSPAQKHQINLATTLTAAQILPQGYLNIGHLGDSGVILFRKNEILRLTTDHTVAQEKILKHGAFPAQIFSETDKNTLTRCLGLPEMPPIDTQTIPVFHNDKILLYTDGVTKTWSTIELHQAAITAKTPETFVENIIAQANARGGPDNVTAIAIFLT